MGVSASRDSSPSRTASAVAFAVCLPPFAGAKSCGSRRCTYQSLPSAGTTFTTGCSVKISRTFCCGAAAPHRSSRFRTASRPGVLADTITAALPDAVVA